MLRKWNDQHMDEFSTFSAVSFQKGSCVPLLTKARNKMDIKRRSLTIRSRAIAFCGFTKPKGYTASQKRGKKREQQKMRRLRDGSKLKVKTLRSYFRYSLSASEPGHASFKYQNPCLGQLLARVANSVANCS